LELENPGVQFELNPKGVVYEREGVQEAAAVTARKKVEIPREHLENDGTADMLVSVGAESKHQARTCYVRPQLREKRPRGRSLNESTDIRGTIHSR
jgi:hypothetical protein